MELESKELWGGAIRSIPISGNAWYVCDNNGMPSRLTDLPFRILPSNNPPCSFQQQKKQIDSPTTMCWAENEDYFECMHGFKEKKRMLQVLAEKQRREANGETFDINKS